ncbi:MAG TPA: ABC transporter permease [Burkholderiales bacterium]|jgi:peptide/nickel transport system permease protein|nr:ABC transporter permease [Burkholderiales bacterium]
MLAFAIRRVVLAAIVAFAVSIVGFGLLRLSGDPAIAMAGPSGTSADIAHIRHEYGFDKPLPVQYWNWMRRAVSGNLGDSYYFRMPVTTMLEQRLPITLTLGVCALLFALVLSLPLGVLAALRPNSWMDRVALTLSVVGQALPSFWFGLMLIVLLGVMFPILPPSGSGSWQHFVMPTIVLGYYATPAFMRLTRTGMLEVLQSDYIRTARAKGLPRWRVVLKHALRNAIIPVVSLAAVQFGFMLGGSIIVETVFGLGGAGYLAWESISRADFPTVQAIVLVYSGFYIVLTLLADLANAWLDPRMRG